MKAVILLNGEPYTGELEAGDYTLCADGAYLWAKDKIRIDEVVGDFDSLKKAPSLPVRKYPSEKNETDGELALRLAADMGATSVVFYGGGGKRPDHFLGNLHLLYLAEKRKISAKAVLNGCEIFPASGRVNFSAPRGATLSLLPFGGDAHIMNSKGLKYPLEDLWLRYGSTRGISNVAEGEVSFFAEGTVLVIIMRGEV